MNFTLLTKSAGSRTPGKQRFDSSLVVGLIIVAHGFAASVATAGTISLHSDSTTKMLVGPDVDDFASPFASPYNSFATHYEAARNGQSATLVQSTRPNWIQELTSNPSAKWISSVADSFDVGNSTLFATDFSVPDAALQSATLRLVYAVDNKLGGGANAGIYINGHALQSTLGLPNSTEAAAFEMEHRYVSKDISHLLRPGTNTLYIYDSNVWSDTRRGRASGLIYDAAIDLIEQDFSQIQAPFYNHQPHDLTRIPGPGGHPDPIDTYALDLAGGNAEVLASSRGTAHVFDLAATSPYGNYVTIDHGQDPTDPSRRLFTLYAHLNEIRVDDGQPVRAGDIIGVEGSTGNSSGPHIHFGIYGGNPTDTTLSTWESVEMISDVGSIVLGTSMAGPFAPYTSDDLRPSLQSTFFSSVIWRPDELTRTEVITAEQSHTVNFLVDPLSSFVDLVLTWPGSELAIDVIQPDGSLFTRLRDTDGEITAGIPNPQAGIWSFRITALDVAPDGDLYTLNLRAHFVPEPNSFLLTGFFALFVFAASSRRCRRTAVLR